MRAIATTIPEKETRRGESAMRETRDLEFKESISDSFLKTVSAFANYRDGKIIFGLDDGGNVVGLDDPTRDALRIENNHLNGV